ncbi:hypothetical protein PVAND_007238 [Polypedilum vanderplanki]|uniref:SHSP domain-containing protein n=1 Tax=Polypedilum vanderplanki TaxID=319348 RepID=A0A9J6C6K4_POLVA|nr:hypothetical protein PVAND_007238 [Polypedilum vanderplanki]
MSRVPLTFRDWWDDFGDDYFDSFRRPRTSRLIDQHFGTALRRNDLLSSLANTHISNTSRTTPYYRPWSTPLAKADSGSTVNVEKDKFQIILDVQQFAPNEISVKTTDKFIIIEGKHDEKQDEHGFVSRHFTRKYMLPSNYKSDNVTSTLSSDGILTISAIPPEPQPINQERSVPITHVGPSRVESTQTSTQESQPKIEQVN